ncbi:MAG: hypothetical protein IT366_23320 [Candidatus Hydrogenedentes bacterium]|nr:hypothetical protein [Candidatus Hydrogenedentota bacterium]
MKRSHGFRLAARACVYALAALLAIASSQISAFASERVKLSIDDAEGFAGGGVAVDITMEADPKPSAIGFWIEYDHTRLTLTDAIPGLVVTLAGKDVSWDFPAPGRASFLIFGLNDTRVSSGRILTLTFDIDDNAEEGEDFEIHGLNASATEPDASTIPTEIDDGEIEILQCFDPAAPTSFVATDGIFGDHVQLTWLPVFGAQSYVVMRNTVNDPATASFLATTILPFYSDFSARGASYTAAGGGGCSGGSGQSLSYTEYYYWVRAQNICGQSGYTAAEMGWRGKSDTSVKSSTNINALPALADETTSEVALRLSAETAIVPTSVTAKAEDAEVEIVNVEWKPISESGNDGWVVVQFARPLNVGESVTVSASAWTVACASVGPVTHSFVAAPLNEVSPTPAGSKAYSLVSVVEATVSNIPDFIESMGPRYEIYPAQQFDAPQHVAIPVPDGVEPSEMLPHLYVDGAGWVPGQLAEGWIVPGTVAVETVNGVPCVTFDANFGGLVQLGYANVAAPPNPSNWAGGVPTLVAALALGLIAAKRRK